MRKEESKKVGGQAHLFHFLWSVQHGPDDHYSVQKVERDAMRRGDILSAPARARMIISPWAFLDQTLDMENKAEALTMRKQLVYIQRVRARVNRLSGIIKNNII